MCREQPFNGVLELRSRIRLLKEVCAFNKQSCHFVGDRIPCCVEHTQFRPKRDGLARKFKPAKGRRSEEAYLAVPGSPRCGMRA
jgi:hypothetical protein